MTSAPVWDIDPVHKFSYVNAAGAGVRDTVLLPRGVAAAMLRAGVNEDVAEEAQQRQQQLLQQAFRGNRAVRFQALLCHVAAVPASGRLWSNQTATKHDTMLMKYLYDRQQI